MEKMFFMVKDVSLN